MARRRAAGLPPTPAAVLLSRSLDLPWDAGLFAAPDQPVLVYTGSDAEPPGVAAPLEVVRLEDPSPARALADLRARGVRALLCEGGPTLNRALLAAGVVDELFLTLLAAARRECGRAADRGRRGPARTARAAARLGAAPRGRALPPLPPVTDHLDAAHALASDWLATLRDRPVHAEGDPAGLRRELPREGADPADVVRELAAAAAPGLVASAGPRYFGFVTGGALPAALGADWLTSAWDQNAGLHSMSPAAAAAEQTVGRWVLELLGLPADAGFGLVTGAQMANVSALAAARHGVLRDAGWDVEARGLIGAPAVRVIAHEETHSTVFNALRVVGLGRDTAIRLPADDQGRMRRRRAARRARRRARRSSAPRPAT